MISTKRKLDYCLYWHPRWWPTWLLLAVMWLVSRLPLNLQWAVGRWLGRRVMSLSPWRRHITDVNLRLCFPQLPDAKRHQLAVRAFEANGIGLIEIGIAWFRDLAFLKPAVTLHGLEYIENARSAGHGVLLLGGHFSSLDLCGSLVAREMAIDVTQRDHNNPLINAVMTRSRQRHYGEAISSKDVRTLLRRLKQNHVIWYAADQDYGKKDIVFAPFFGVPAASITATARIVARTGCTVIPFSHFRRENAPGYDIYFHPPLTNFPTSDELADATCINAFYEQEIRRHPDQYLWMHRRFKTRPATQPETVYGRRSEFHRVPEDTRR